LVLQNNGGNDLAITANGSFVFSAAVGSWSVYAVTIKTQPTKPPQTCVVSRGNGTLAISNVSNVVVTCATQTHTVGGSVSGLVGSGLVLQDNGGNDLAIAANGNFVFSAAVAIGSAYAVTIKTQPVNPSQTCVLSGAKGTIGAANITNVVATCTIQPYTVGGSVGGLIGSGLVLQDNGGNDLAIAANGSFVFSAAVASGSAYAVTIKTQPANPSQTCVVSTASGTIGAANVSNVVATCTIQPGRFAYVSGTGIYCFAIDAISGALTALAGSPCGASSQQNGLAVDPSGTFAYATLDSSNQVTAYAIDNSTGTLTAIVGSTLNGGGTNPLDVAVDPTGQFVYMANYAGSISAFTINSATGGLTTVSGSPFPTPPPIPPNNYSGVNSVTVDPTGKFVYAALNGANAIPAYTINSSTGALTPVIGSPFTAGSVPYTVRVDPSGRFVYAVNLDSDNISAYSINSASGALTPIAGSPFSTGATPPPLPGPQNSGPSGLGIDPSGRFVFVTNSNSNSISAFSIVSSTGALTPIPGSPFASGAGPSGAFVHPSGKFLYVTNNGAGTISGYTIDGTSGALTPISGSPFVASGSGSNGTYVIAFSN
jgi:6-phosphogluconolactonase (cycloisomerase 2 family)